MDLLPLKTNGAYSSSVWDAHPDGSPQVRPPFAELPDQWRARLCRAATCMMLLSVGMTAGGQPDTPSPTATALTLEQFGGQAYYKRFDGTLTYTPHAADPTILKDTGLPDGENYTKITYTGTEAVFDQADLGKSFCGLFVHKNPGVPDTQHADLYYPNILGSRYANVVKVMDGKNLIVDFAFNGGNLETPQVTSNAKGYLFFDNSEAWAALMAEYTKPGNTQTEIRLQEHGRNGALQSAYVIPQYSAVELPDKPLTLWTGTAKKARIKIGIEDYFQWDRVNAPLYRQDAYLFLLSPNPHNRIIHNIAWLPPHRTVPENQPVGRAFFRTARIGPCERILAIVGNTALDEQREIQAAGGLTEERFRCLGVGFIHSGGTYKGEGLTEDVAGYQYILLKDFEHTAHSLTELKANSGAGNFLVMENVTTEYSDEPYWNPPAILVEGRFIKDKSGLHPDIVQRDYYPEEIFEITSSHSFHQVDNTYHLHGWANFCNVLFVDRFAFLIGNDSTWRQLYEPLFSEGKPMFDWSLPREFNKSHMRTSRKHMVAQRIPRAGQKYVIGREYEAEKTSPIRSVKEIAPNKVRSFINWTLVLQKTLPKPFFPDCPADAMLIDPATDIPRNAKPIQLQAGDQFRIVGRGEDLYTVQDNDRGGYWSWPHEYWEGGEGYLYTCHTLDKNLPDQLPLAFEIEMVTSTSEYLLDGKIRPAWVGYKGNDNWTSTMETRFGDPQVLRTNPMGHVAYNHKAFSMWARNVQLNGFYRESWHHDESAFDITDPDTGEKLTISRLARYPQGTTLINCSGFQGQFTGGLFDLVRRDKIQRSLGIQLPDEQVAKIRLFGCRDIKVPPEGHYLVEQHESPEGAPDMPAPCRALLNALP